MTLCRKHYSRIRDNKNPTKRTRYDPNELIYQDNYCEIVIYDYNSKPIAKAKVDIEDVEKVMKHKWSLEGRNKYVVTRVKRKSIKLHRVIMDCPDDMVVDHISHDRLDNRKCNLRICTRKQNLHNLKQNKRNTSGQIGVSFDKKSSKWRARIFICGKEIRLGNFYNIQEAIAARKAAEKKYYGEFAYKGGD